MKTCPACNTAVPEISDECSSCGIVFAKWKPRDERSRVAPPRPTPWQSTAGSAAVSQRRTLAVVLLGVLFAVATLGFFYLKPRASSGSVEQSGKSGYTLTDLDHEFELPGGPIGLAAAGSDFLVANRDKPWGFIRLRPNATGDGLKIDRIPVIEPTYNQQVGFSAVTWNGVQYVAYTSGGWFQKQDEMVFTFHDPETLQITRQVPAPEGLGCIAWDGTGYWAGSRKNTQFADEPAWLYRLDESLRVVSTYEPPAVGCQGLAWDGAHLWFADVFSDNLYVLDVNSDPPAVLLTNPTAFDYLSGVTYANGQIWFAEYGNDQLHRLGPELMAELEGLPLTSAVAADVPSMSSLGSESPDSGGGDGVAYGDIERLLSELRSGDYEQHSSARMLLEMRGVPIDYAWHLEMFPSERGPEDLEVSEWAIELKAGNLYGLEMR